MANSKKKDCKNNKNLLQYQEFQLISRYAVSYEDLNMHRKLFGGRLLSWLDAAGYIFVCKICCATNFVTVAMNNVNFRHSANLGDFVCIYGKLENIGNTSITIKLKAEREQVCSKKKEENDVIIECVAVYVKIADNGKPIKIFNKQK